MGAWVDALSRLEDRLATRFDQFLQGHPAWDRWMEATLHAHGLHGPAARHLLKTRVLPITALVAAGVLLLIAALIVRLATRRRRRRRRPAVGRPRLLPR
jgi:hypothetical protein